MIDWIVSLASLLVSIVAIVISIQQTSLSNKQQLFEKRADKYIEICDLINNCRNTRSCLNQKMILRSSTLVISYLLSPLRVESEDKQLSVITANRHLKKSAVEISLLWKDKNFKLVEDFFNLYAELMIKIWDYNFRYDLIKEEFSECLSEEIEARLNHEAEELQLSQQCDVLLKVAKQIEQDDILLSLKKSIRL